jgi:hypothetical protein
LTTLVMVGSCGRWQNLVRILFSGWQGVTRVFRCQFLCRWRTEPAPCFGLIGSGCNTLDAAKAQDVTVGNKSFWLVILGLVLFVKIWLTLKLDTCTCRLGRLFSNILGLCNAWGVTAVPTHIRSSCTVQNALHALLWVRGVVFAQPVQVAIQYLRLWDMLRDFHLSDQPNRFIWKWSSSGEFSSSSAYRVMFVGRTHLAGVNHIWKVQAPDRCRFFGWLVLHGHC